MIQKNTSKSLLGICLAVLLTASFASPAFSVPALQMYVEGATYDHDSESWLIGSSDIKLWVIGNVGQKGPILDVQLTAAFLTSETGSISISSTTTSLLPDPSTPFSPTLNTAVGADGTIPVMSNGRNLPTHGIYGAGTSFTQWDVGDMTLTDSPVGDFIDGFPTSFPQSGQINAYSISISGYTMVHFDVFNHVESANSALFAPFSHDAETAVPEPGTYVLLGLGLAVCAIARKRRKRSG